MIYYKNLSWSDLWCHHFQYSYLKHVKKVFFVYHLPYFDFPPLKDRLCRIWFLIRRQFCIFFENIFHFRVSNFCVFIFVSSNPFLLCSKRNDSMCQSPVCKGHLLWSLLYTPNFILHNKSSATPICDNSEGSIRGWMYQCLMYLLIKN